MLLADRQCRAGAGDGDGGLVVSNISNVTILMSKIRLTTSTTANSSFVALQCLSFHSSCISDLYLDTR